MLLDQFTDEMFKDLQRGDEQVAVGQFAAAFAEEGYETKRQNEM